MFLLDSLMISGIQWTLKTVLTAAEAEMNDDSALRDRLLEAEMQREMGEISDDEFAAIEADLLQAIREIKARREGSGPLAFGSAQPIDAGEHGRFEVEAELAGEFYGEEDRSGRSDRPLATEHSKSAEVDVTISIPRTTRTRTSRTSRMVRTPRTIRTPRRK